MGHLRWSGVLPAGEGSDREGRAGSWLSEALSMNPAFERLMGEVQFAPRP